MSRRKDRERFHRLKQQNPDYTGFRGVNTVTPRKPAELESVTCSVCQRKRNVPIEAIPEDRASFVCIQCQGDREKSEEEVSD